MFLFKKQLQEALAAKPNRFDSGNGADCSTDTSEHAVYKKAGSVIHAASLFLIASSIISHKKFIVKSKMISASIPARSNQTKTKSIKTTTHHKKKGSQDLSGGAGCPKTSAVEGKEAKWKLNFITAKPCIYLR